MTNLIKKKLDLFFNSCELVLNHYRYQDENIASFECTHISGVIYGAAERCDLREYIEVLPAEAFGNAHCVLRCNDRIIDFTFSQFDESRKWPIKTKRKVKGLKIIGTHQPEAAEIAIKMAEDS